jgi:hypothetical protein
MVEPFLFGDAIIGWIVIDPFLFEVALNFDVD